MLAIIPARGGSKRFPNKNISVFNGKRLIDRAIEQAIDSKLFTDIVFTSDDQRAINFARQYDIDIDERPASLATDDTRIVEVVKYLLSQDRYQHHQEVALLFLTSPLRTVQDITNTAAKLIDGYDSAQTVTEYPIAPQFALDIQGDNIVPWHSYDYFRVLTTKQKIPKLYYPNYAVQMFRREVVFTYNGFLGEKSGYVIIPPERAVDVDTKLDFKMAEFLSGYSVDE